MEASEAGTAVEAGEGEGGQEQGGVSLSELSGRMDAWEQRFGSQIGELGSRFDEFSSALQDEPDDEPEQPQRPGRYVQDPESGTIFDRITGEPLSDDEAARFGEPEPMSRQDLSSMIEDRAREIAREENRSLHEAEQTRQIRALEEHYPELRTDDRAKLVADEAKEFAAELGLPEAWKSPRVLEQVYLAQKARERAGQEEPADGQYDGQLESAGAMPPSAEGTDVGDAIVNAGRGDGFWK